MTRTVVWINTTFVGFHRYKDAPKEVEFLRAWHRHVFHVRVGVSVEGLNREVEFFNLKGRVNEFLQRNYEGQSFEKSCEMIAHHLSTFFSACEVTVSEDGENGATVTTEEYDA